MVPDLDAGVAAVEFASVAMDIVVARTENADAGVAVEYVDAVGFVRKVKVAELA